MSKKLQEGNPHPRGASWDGEETNFAVFSAHATKVEICLFDREGQRELERIALPEYTDQVWHGYVRDVRPGLRMATECTVRMNPPWAIVSVRTSYS